MRSHAAITVLRPREEVEREWHRQNLPPELDATVHFVDAPGDRGTEIHVELAREAPGGGPVGDVVMKVAGAKRLAKVKDALRQFKQLVEAGEIARSDASPGGELAERKPWQRPARPLNATELEKVSAR